MAGEGLEPPRTKFDPSQDIDLATPASWLLYVKITTNEQIAYQSFLTSKNNTLTLK